MMTELQNSSLSLMGEGWGEGVSTRIERARKLRTNMTDAERKFWRTIRGEAFTGWKFRRQHPVGPYVADFACAEVLLIVEIDGGQHCENQNDINRTRWLEDRGWTVIRFWNNDVLQNMNGTAETLLRHLQKASLHRQHTLTRRPAGADLSHEGEVNSNGSLSLMGEGWGEGVPLQGGKRS